MAKKIVVQGKVQGVFFRKSTQKQAKTLNITGWVQNLPEGHVQIWAEGEEEALQKFTRWVNEGPPQARVSNIKEQDVEDIGHPDFIIKY